MINDEIIIEENLTDEEFERLADRLVEEAHSELAQQPTTEATIPDLEDLIITTPTTIDESTTIVNTEFTKEIPENSDSLLVSETTSRFSSAIWYDNIKTKDILVAGIGGIGSYVVFLLSRMTPNSILVYDPDIVEAANMSGQLYCTIDIGNSKTSAIAKMVSFYSQYFKISCFRQRFATHSVARDIMICGFDNMAARKAFFNSWYEWVKLHKEEDKKDCLFIDGRLAAENFQILCIRGDDTYNIERYKNEFLFNDEEADATICSYKQTSFCANMIASYMVNLFVNFAANQCDPLMERDLPFYIEYDASLMYFKTQN